jgi:hypothetical protein
VDGQSGITQIDPVARFAQGIGEGFDAALQGNGEGSRLCAATKACRDSSSSGW